MLLEEPVYLVFYSVLGLFAPLQELDCLLSRHLRLKLCFVPHLVLFSDA